jgi:REP element-mobilizing transposase RayT
MPLRERDRRRYLHWVFETKKRFGLCVLDYVVTSNHIHLLVKDNVSGVIAESMQLNTEASSNRSKRSTASLRSKCFTVLPSEHQRPCVGR